MSGEFYVKAVEKLPKQIFGRDAEKSHLIRIRHNQRSHAGVKRPPKIYFKENDDGQMDCYIDGVVFIY